MILLSAFTDQVAAYFHSVPAQWVDFRTHLPEYLPIIGALVLIEGLLSVDNAAVLATMVRDLPKTERAKALRYGLLGAYAFRGICLIAAGFLVSVWWLKPVGGLYLVYLSLHWWATRHHRADGSMDKPRGRLYRATAGRLGNFWATVILVELMDIAFSIDNVFASVAYTPNIIAIWIGVAIGILAMRFVAQAFVRLMDRFSFLEYSAFLLIGLLGAKLVLSLYTHFYPCGNLALFMEGSGPCDAAAGVKSLPGRLAWAGGETLTTALTIGVFVLPLLGSLLFSFPKKSSGNDAADSGETLT